MNIKRLTPTLITCLGLLLSSCDRCGGKLNRQQSKPPKTVVALIFCDVTNSLTEKENRRVGNIAVDVLDSLPEGAIFKLYPIQIQTQMIAPIALDLNEDKKTPEANYQVLRGPTSSTEEQAQREKMEKQKKNWGEQIPTAVDALYDQMNKGLDNRTCIVNTLGFASNLIKDYADADKYEVRIYLISDMIEECSNTPLPGRLVKMNHPNISDEISRAAAFRPGNSESNNSESNDSQPNDSKFKCNLAGVNLYCVFPAASDTSMVPSERRPNRDNVKAFWGYIFRACGVNSQQLAWIDSGDLTRR